MNAVREALYDTLNGDSALAALATGGVYHRLAEGNLPYVIFNKMSGVPSMQTFEGPDADDDVWLVKGVADRAAVAEDIAARCLELLDQVELDIDGKDHKYLRRISDVDYGEVVSGERVDHVGHEFRLVSEASS